MKSSALKPGLMADAYIPIMQEVEGRRTGSSRSLSVTYQVQGSAGVLFPYLIALMKYNELSNIREERCVYLHSWFEGTVLMAGKAWQRELQADAHSAATVRKQRVMDVSVTLSFPFSLSPEFQPLRVYGRLLLSPGDTDIGQIRPD